jgi:hypothetical protein
LSNDAPSSADKSPFFGGAEPRSNSVDNLREFITFLTKTEVKIPNPTFRVFIIGRKVLNYCGNFGAEQ